VRGRLLSEARIDSGRLPHRPPRSRAATGNRAKPGVPHRRRDQRTAAPRQIIPPSWSERDFEAGTGIASGRAAHRFPPPWRCRRRRAAPKLAYAAGKYTALEARVTMGVQWIFAPDADVNTHPDNPIINIRSFGEDPAERRGVCERVFVRGVEDKWRACDGKTFSRARQRGRWTHISHYHGAGRPDASWKELNWFLSARQSLPV